MRDKADIVYLFPPKIKLTIFHSKLVLNDSEHTRSGIFLPIDIFCVPRLPTRWAKAAGATSYHISLDLGQEGVGIEGFYDVAGATGRQSLFAVSCHGV